MSALELVILTPCLTLVGQVDSGVYYKLRREFTCASFGDSREYARADVSRVLTKQALPDSGDTTSVGILVSIL